VSSLDLEKLSKLSKYFPIEVLYWVRNSIVFSGVHEEWKDSLQVIVTENAMDKSYREFKEIAKVCEK